jgi:FAD/FMN-containing dehydrogenase
MTLRVAPRKLGAWSNFPVQDCFAVRPEKQGDLRRLPAAGALPDYISRGMGSGYGDGALNAGSGVILHERLGRLLDFDADTGVVTAEGGACFADLIETFLPRGWFLPVTPGTKYVSLGGAIAADVHGKNHHADGSIGRYLLDFELLTGAGDVLHCSRDENADVYFATLGGMGLTGAILSARLQLRKVESAYVAVKYQRAKDLDGALELFATGDRNHRFSVAWIDCLSSGESFGRSVLMRGDHAPASRLTGRAADAPLAPPAKRRVGVPFFMPPFVLNPWSVKVFNAMFYRRHADRDALVDYDSYFYPLDSVPHWNRFYGRRGYLQYQVVLPHASARTGLVRLLEKLVASRRASFLAVLKAMGPESGGLLSFPTPGYTLALDLPYTGPDVLEFLRGLDEVVLAHGGRVYLAKDTCMKPETFERMYPRLEAFRQVKRRLDPHDRFASSLAKRLGIVGAAGRQPVRAAEEFETAAARAVMAGAT